MGNQFKKPFLPPEEPSRAPTLSDQDTLVTPATSAAPAPNPPPSLLSPQGYAPGHQPQPDLHLAKPFLHGTGPTGSPGEQSTYLMNQQRHFGRQEDRLTGRWGDALQPTLFRGMPLPPKPMGHFPEPRGNSRDFRADRLADNGLAGFAQRNWQRPVSGIEKEPTHMQPRAKGRIGKQGKKRHRVPIWARVVIGLLLFFMLLGTGGFLYYQVYFASTINSITGKNFVRPKGETDPNKNEPSDVLNWGRITLLLLGSDTDEKAGVWVGNSYLAQTVIVASIDTATHEVDMLSIPRDFYIHIPDHGMDKLDTAFAYGGSINHDMSGVGTVVDTLDQDFGIKINFYGWVGLQGFIKVINTVNGVDVNVMHPVVDDTYPDDIAANGTGKAGFGYKRVYIGDGPQHLDGATALEYVRSRHSTTDFDRSARQQQVLSALRLKLDNANIIGQLPQIAQDLQGSLYTNLSPTQLLELGNFARGIDANKIKHLTLSAPTYGKGATVLVHSQLEDVVEPNCARIPGTINTFLHITTGSCNITSLPTNQGPLLTNMPANSSGDRIDTLSSTNASTATYIGQSRSIPQPISNDLFGIRDLLDMMSMVVLDSAQM